MKFNDAVSLIRVPGLASGGPSNWADLGAGSGLFSTALASLLAPGSTIYAVDKAPGIRRQVTDNDVTIIPRKNNFVEDDLQLLQLDGILMANSFHFVQDKVAMMNTLKAMIRPCGILILVEYDTNHPNHWVPYPVTFASLTGFTFINNVNSVYQDAGIYGAYKVL